MTTLNAARAWLFAALFCFLGSVCAQNLVAVPELAMDLPATAIGKDYLGNALVSSAPSGSGFQLSLGGLLGIAASGVDGLELNLLGLNFGISPSGIKLPLIGRIGAPRPVSAAIAHNEPFTP